MKSILKHQIKVIKKTKTTSKYGEEIFTEEVVNTIGLVSFRRGKIVNENEHIFEDFIYQCFIPSEVDIKKNDEIEWNGIKFVVRNIGFVLNPNGASDLYMLEIERKA